MTADSLAALYPVADLENFTWGGKGVARDLGRVAGEDGTWKPSYIN